MGVNIGFHSAKELKSRINYFWASSALTEANIQEFSGLVPLANSWSGEFLRQPRETANSQQLTSDVLKQTFSWPKEFLLKGIVPQFFLSIKAYILDSDGEW